MIDFILASGSPRRKELLELMGLEFKVIVSQADEDSVSKDLKPELYVQELALLKASATAKEVLRNKNAVIISADTIVTLDGQILGKPKTKMTHLICFQNFRDVNMKYIRDIALCE